jgi:hypothetical protein
MFGAVVAAIAAAAAAAGVAAAARPALIPIPARVRRGRRRSTR